MSQSLASQSLAIRIKADLEQKILSGAWPPGTRLQYEHELMALYGCSRMTVSNVLNAIGERGLIIRRRRSGSFVASPPADHAVLQIERFDELAAVSGQSYRHDILKRINRKARREEATRLGLEASSRVAEIECLHVIADQPIAWERRLIVLAVVPNAECQDFAAMPPGVWLLHHIPWTSAEHVVLASNASAPVSRLLSIVTGTACLELHRRTWAQGLLVTDVCLVHPGSRYRLSGRFVPPNVLPQSGRN